MTTKRVEASMAVELLADAVRRVGERYNQHLDNLRLWESGFLTPTEPDPQERECVIRELKACVAELAPLVKMLGM